MYTRKTWKSKNEIEIAEYHDCRYGAPGKSRTKRRKATPEEMEKQNQRNRERKARHKLWANFKEDDYFSTWTFKKESRPQDMGQAKQIFSKVIGTIRREYKKRGHKLRWIRNIEVGTKNAWHIHIVLNRIPDTDLILKKAWTYGGIHNELLYTSGEFTKLAVYLCKTPKTDKRLKENSYSTSKGLAGIDPKKRVMKGKTWKKEIKPPKGWYIDKESVRQGENKLTGQPYRTYILFRIQRE